MNTNDKARAQELTRADDERYAAMLNNDIATLTRFLADELIYTHSSAVVDSKSQYLNSLKNGNVQYKDIDCRRSDILFFSETAIVHGHVDLQVIINDAPKSLGNLFQSVWLERNGGWQMLAWASTAIPGRSSV